MTAEAEADLKVLFQRMHNGRDRHFGNAREARNIFERVKAALATRTAGIDNPTLEDLKTIRKEDIR